MHFHTLFTVTGNWTLTSLKIPKFDHFGRWEGSPVARRQPPAAQRTGNNLYKKKAFPIINETLDSQQDQIFVKFPVWGGVVVAWWPHDPGVHTVSSSSSLSLQDWWRCDSRDGASWYLYRPGNIALSALSASISPAPTGWSLITGLLNMDREESGDL